MSSWQSAARSRHSTEQPPQLDTLNVPISNPTKVLYPSGYTKTQIIDYYIQVAPFILPHIRDRPVTMKRYPDGVRGEFFYEKNAPTFTPAWVQTFTVVRKSGGQIRYILLNDARTLVWAANLANLEIHPFLHHVPELQRPTSIVLSEDDSRLDNDRARLELLPINAPGFSMQQAEYNRQV